MKFPVVLFLLTFAASIEGLSILPPCFPNVRPSIYLDPCIGATCPRYPYAECRAETGRCFSSFAAFYVNDRKVNCHFPICPRGLSRVYCLVDPCLEATCPHYPDATCARDRCGWCKARFYKNGHEVNCDAGCSLEEPFTRCKVNPCTVSKCPRYPKAECTPNYCGGCKAEYRIGGVKVECKRKSRLPSCDGPPLSYCPAIKQNECGLTRRCGEDEYCCYNGCYNQCKRREAECPSSSPARTCDADPCLYAKCRGQTGAVCRVNNCGECKAEFYKNGEKVECDVPNCPPPLVNPIVAFCLGDQCSGTNQCPDGKYCCFSGCSNSCIDKELPPSCPADKPEVTCAVDPCLYATCQGKPSAMCVSNNCGSCTAEFFINDVKVECDVPNCAPPLVNPIISTCLANECDADKPCADEEYCCFTGCSNTCKMITPNSCPSGVQRVTCLHNPCKYAKCQGYKDAVCKINDCGECKADFYQNARKVTCEVPVCAPPLMNPLTSKCMKQCDVDQPCPPNQFCCFNGCTNQCYYKPVKLPQCPSGISGNRVPGPGRVCLDECQNNRDCISGSCCKSKCGNVCFNIKPQKGVCPDSVTPPMPGPPSPRPEPPAPMPGLPAPMPGQPLPKPHHSVAKRESPPGTFDPCPHHCSDDYDCSGSRVCCSSGCGRMCVDSVPKHDPCLLEDMTKCYRNPCAGKNCGGHPNAVCRANYCGGCFDEWFVDGKRVYCFVIGK